MKKNVKLSALALFSTLVLAGGFASGSVVSADTIDKTAKSEAYVTFTQPTKPNGPYDPTTPTTDNPDTDNATGDTGLLTLDAVPKRLNFGSQEVTSTEQTLTLLAANSTDRANSQGTDFATTSRAGASNNNVIYTQVTDLLSDDVTKDADGTVTASTPVQWTLSAQLGNFTTNGAASLPGASITFSNPTSQNLTGTADALKWIGSTEGGLVSTMKLDAGKAAVTYLTSQTKGTSQQVWDTNNVKLNVPAGAQTVGDATAEVTWTLSATPSDN